MARTQIQALLAWWLDRMVAAEHQLTEKLVFFWHGHWATSVQKVKSGHADAAASWRRSARARPRRLRHARARRCCATPR